MKNLVKFVLLAAIAITAMTACDDETSEIGSSLIQDQVEINIDSAFTVTGHPVPSGKIQSRTILQLLGMINAKEYGVFSSDIVTQFMPSQNLVTEGVSIDSLKLIMRVPLGGYVGDSLTPMGLEIYKLNTQLPTPIYSDYDISGKYDPTPIARGMYNVTGAGMTEAQRKAPFRYINVDLDTIYGRELLEKFKSSPSTFATPSAFADWFPGIYIRSSFGSGRVVQIDSTVVTMYYHQTQPISGADRDTTYYRSASYLAVTPEVVTNNNMKLVMAPTLDAMAAAGEPILVAPGGYDVEIRFPGKEIAERYRDNGALLSVINALSFKIPVNEIENNYGLTPPPYVLMVKSSEKDNFFLQSKLPNDKTSFYAAYDSYNKCYNFTDMRDYILDLLEKDEITDDDITFTITPVTVAFENNSSPNYYYYYNYFTQPTTALNVAGVTPYVNKPAMGLLDLSKAKIVFTYSEQNIDF